MTEKRISHRALLRSAGVVALGAGGAWAVWRVTRSSGPREGSSITPPGHKETPGEQGRGLRLEWAEKRFEVRYGHEEDLVALIVNEGFQHWIDNKNGEFYAIATLTQPNTGQVLGNGQVAIAGVGRTYDFAPGSSVRIPVVIAGFDGPVPPGDYGMTAIVSELGLASPSTTLRVVAN